MSNVYSFSTGRKENERPPSPPSDTLSFVTMRKGWGDGYNYWDVQPTGQYAEDCETGAALAKEYLAFIGRWPTTGNAGLLQMIVRDMIERKSWSGVHVGFLAGVNRYAMATARQLETGRP